MTRHPSEKPKAGESIFAADEPRRLNARTDFLRGDWLACAEGFRAVAERAAKHLMRDHAFADYELYGFAALWRHHLELMLKGLVQVAEIEGADDALQEHRLVPLWQLLQPFFDRNAIAIGEWTKERKLIDRVVRDFDQIDPLSFDFRYSANRPRTKASLARAPARINVARLNKWMVWTADTLSGVFDAVTGGEGAVFVPGTEGIKLGSR